MCGRSAVELQSNRSRIVVVTTALSTPIQSDVAALSETVIYGVVQLEETGAGYAFFFIGHPAVGTPQAGGLAVLSTLLRIQGRPIDHSLRLMSLKIELRP